MDFTQANLLCILQLRPNLRYPSEIGQILPFSNGGPGAFLWRRIGCTMEKEAGKAMQDKTLTCRDCGAEFVFTAAEQEFYAEKGFTNEPGRCPACRSARRQQNGGSDRPSREMFPAVCAGCGRDTEVPFRPSGNRPVYCRDCFNKEQGR